MDNRFFNLVSTCQKNISINIQISYLYILLFVILSSLLRRQYIELFYNPKDYSDFTLHQIKFKQTTKMDFIENKL